MPPSAFTNRRVSASRACKVRRICFSTSRQRKCIKITLCTNFRVSRYIFVAKKTLLSETIFARDNCKENSILEWYIEQCLLKLVSQLQPSTTAIRYETCFWDVIRELCWRSTSPRVTKCFSSIMRGMQLVKFLQQEAGTK